MNGKNLSRSEIDGKLRDLKTKLDNLRRNYEQYFVGNRERPPQNLRRQVERLVRELEQSRISNTSQRFRLRSLVQRFSSYRQKWNRVQREIEQGTYEPHKKRAKRRLEKKKKKERDQERDRERGEASEAPDDGAVELDMELEDVDLGDLQEELEQMDEAGAFEKYVDTEKVQRSDLDRSDQADTNPFQQQPETQQLDPDELDRREKLREKQDELGISSGRDRRNKLQQMRERLEDDGAKDSGSDGGRQENRGEWDRNAQEPTEQIDSLESKLRGDGGDRDDEDTRNRSDRTIARPSQRSGDSDEDASDEE